MGKLHDLSGIRFGRQVVISRAGTNKWGNATWLCLCDCGNRHVVPGGKLLSGQSTSCGCYAIEMRSKNATVHGYTRRKKPRTLTIWNGMKARCLNPKSVSYSNYGARGIGICDEWLSFKNFHEWAIANGYADNLQLDRIDNDGDYCPSNCRWVTRSENQKNTRRTRLITINGKTQCASDWIKELGVSKSTFYSDLRKGQAYFIGRYCGAVSDGL